jgi:hypothetical protein
MHCLLPMAPNSPYRTEAVVDLRESAVDVDAEIPYRRPKYVIRSIGAADARFYSAPVSKLPRIGTVDANERSELRFRSCPQSRHDEAIGRADEHGELGARVHVQLLVDVDYVRGDRADSSRPAAFAGGAHAAVASATGR